MVYFASNAVAPAMTAGGPQTYQNPYYKTQCGCGSSHGNGANIVSDQMREGFTAAGPRPAMPLQAGSAPMCTLTATAPPAGCCHPAPLHCDCCNGSGFFRASEAYGS